MPAAALFRHEHHTVHGNAAGALNSGDIVVQADGRLGVVCGMSALATGDPVAYAVNGQHDLDSASATTFAVGEQVFWDTSTLKAVAVQTANTRYAGRCTKAKVSGDLTVLTDLNVNTPPRIPVAAVTATGSVQGDAAPLIEGFNVVTGADGTKGVLLPVAVPGMQVSLKGVTSAVLKVWPSTGAAINAIAANSALSLTTGLMPSLFIASSATQWYSVPLVAS